MSASAWTSTARTVLIQLAITILFLAILEGAARLVFSGQREKWFIVTSDAGWDRRPNFDGLDECRQRRKFDAQGLLSVDGAQLRERAPGHRRVIFLGDSNTYGYCLTTVSTFVEVADELLPAFDLINLGVPGYTSLQGYKQLLKYGEWIKPDIVFISFNFNDRRYASGDTDSDAVFKRMAGTPVMQLLERSYLFRLVKAVGTKLHIIRSPGDATGPIRVDTLKPRVDPESYKANLIRMIEWAREHGSTPYLLLLGDNPNQTALLQRGIDHLERKDYEEAIKDLTLVVSNSTSHFRALARKYLSVAYRESGQAAQADQALLVQPLYSAHGGLPVRLDTEYITVMRDVAREQNVPLVDARSKLNENSRVFFDVVHFDAEGHELVGYLIKDVLAKTDSDARQTSPRPSASKTP